VFLRLASPSGGRLHAPGSSWLLAGLVTAGVVAAALAVAFGLGRRPGAPRSRRAAVLGAATGISWGFMAAVIKELSAHLGHGPGAIFSAWSLYVLIAAGAVTMLLASHALAAGPLAASQPGFTVLDPLAASLLGVFLFGEHIRTGPWYLAGQALALAVVIAGAAALSRSLGGDAPRSRQDQPVLSSAASASPAPLADPADPPVPGSGRARRPRALSPDVAIPVSRTRPGPAPAAARTGSPRLARGNHDFDPEPAAA
jgi:hypothetical protein